MKKGMWTNKNVCPYHRIVLHCRPKIRYMVCPSSSCDRWRFRWTRCNVVQQTSLHGAGRTTSGLGRIFNKRCNATLTLQNSNWEGEGLESYYFPSLQSLFFERILLNSLQLLGEAFPAIEFKGKTTFWCYKGVDI